MVCREVNWFRVIHLVHALGCRHGFIARATGMLSYIIDGLRTHYDGWVPSKRRNNSIQVDKRAIVSGLAGLVRVDGLGEAIRLLCSSFDGCERQRQMTLTRGIGGCDVCRVYEDMTASSSLIHSSPGALDPGILQVNIFSGEAAWFCCCCGLSVRVEWLDG